MLQAEKCLENNETRDSPLGNERSPSPLPPNRPKAGDSGGEELVRNADPGRREGGQRSRGTAVPSSFPRLPLGYILTPLQVVQNGNPSIGWVPDILHNYRLR